MAHCRIKTKRALFQTLLLLTAVSPYILSVFFLSPSALGDDYIFRDKEYNEVALPKRPIIRMDRPGILLNAAAPHIPQIKIKSRHSGLETLRLLEFEFPEMPEGDTRESLYVLDKDGLIIGHAGLGPDRQAQVQFNSVINYVRIYVECSKHGLWRKELEIPVT